jgi:hypothetical protein
MQLKNSNYTIKNIKGGLGLTALVIPRLVNKEDAAAMRNTIYFVYSAFYLS